MISTIPKNTIIDQTLIPEESTKIAFKSKSKKSKKRASNEIDLESDDEPVKTKKSKKTKLDLQKKTSKPDGQKKMSDFFKKPAVKDIATLKEEGGDISKDSDSKMLYPTPINVIVIESSPIKAPLKISQEIEIPGLFDEIIDTSLELPTHSPKKTSFDIQKDPTENEVIVIQSSPIRPTDVSSSKSNPIESITISESPIKLNTDVNESKKTILVIEEADIIFAQDKGFWSCVSNLLSTSKTPVIITSTETPFDSQNYSMSSSLLSFFNEMVHVVNVEPDRAEVSLFLTALACLNDIVVDNYDDIDLRHGKLNLLSPIKYSAIDYNDLFQDCENLSVFDLLCDYGLYDCAEVGQEEDQVSTFPILELSKYLTERTSNVTCREEIHDRLRSVKDDNPESRFV